MTSREEIWNEIKQSRAIRSDADRALSLAASVLTPPNLSPNRRYVQRPSPPYGRSTMSPRSAFRGGRSLNRRASPSPPARIAPMISQPKQVDTSPERSRPASFRDIADDSLLRRLRSEAGSPVLTRIHFFSVLSHTTTQVYSRRHEPWVPWGWWEDVPPGWEAKEDPPVPTAQAPHFDHTPAPPPPSPSPPPSPPPPPPSPSLSSSSDDSEPPIIQPKPERVWSSSSSSSVASEHIPASVSPPPQETSLVQLRLGLEASQRRLAEERAAHESAQLELTRARDLFQSEPSVSAWMVLAAHILKVCSGATCPSSSADARAQVREAVDQLVSKQSVPSIVIEEEEEEIVIEEEEEIVIEEDIIEDDPVQEEIVIIDDPLQSDLSHLQQELELHKQLLSEERALSSSNLARAKSSDAEVAEIKALLRTTKQQQRSTQVELAALQQSISESTALLTDEIERRKTAESHIEHARASFVSLTSEVESLRHRETAWIQKSDSVAADALAASREQIDDEKRKHSALIEEHTATVAKLRENLENRLKTHADELNRLKEQHLEEIESLRESYTSKHAQEMDQLRDEKRVESEDSHISELNRLKEQHLEEIESLRESYTSKNAQEMDQLRAQTDQMKEDLSLLQNECDEAKAALAVTRQQKERNEDSLMSLQQTLGHARSQLAEAEGRATANEIALAAVKQESQQIQDSPDGTSSLLARLAEMTVSVEQTKAHAKALEEAAVIHEADSEQQVKTANEIAADAKERLVAAASQITRMTRALEEEKTKHAALIQATKEQGEAKLESARKETEQRVENATSALREQLESLELAKAAETQKMKQLNEEFTAKKIELALASDRIDSTQAQLDQLKAEQETHVSRLRSEAAIARAESLIQEAKDVQEEANQAFEENKQLKEEVDQLGKQLAAAGEKLVAMRSSLAEEAAKRVSAEQSLEAAAAEAVAAIRSTAGSALDESTSSLSVSGGFPMLRNRRASLAPSPSSPFRRPSSPLARPRSDNDAVVEKLKAELENAHAATASAAAVAAQAKHREDEAHQRALTAEAVAAVQSSAISSHEPPADKQASKPPAQAAHESKPVAPPPVDIKSTRPPAPVEEIKPVEPQTPPPVDIPPAAEKSYSTALLLGSIGLSIVPHISKTPTIRDRLIAAARCTKSMLSKAVDEPALATVVSQLTANDTAAPPEDIARPLHTLQEETASALVVQRMWRGAMGRAKAQKMKALNQAHASSFEALLSEEKTYTAGLRCVVEMYQDPLFKFAAEGHPIIPAASIQDIFSCVGVLYRTHCALLIRLRNELTEADLDAARSRPGRAFVAMAQALSAYSLYANSLSHAQITLERLKRTTAPFAEFLSSPRNQSKDKPIQTKSSSVMSVVVLGDPGIGATSFLRYFMTGEGVETHEPTIEEHYEKEVTVDGLVSSVQFVETASGEAFADLQQAHLGMADAVLVMYSITSAKSFDAANALLERVERLFPSLSLVLVGNHSDESDNREVSVEEGKALSTRFHCRTLETATYRRGERWVGRGVHETVQALVRGVRQARRLQREEQAKTLASLLVLPAKRPASLLSRLRKLANATWDDHKDKNDILLAVGAIEELCKTTNSRVQEAIHVVELVNLQESFHQSVPMIVREGRRKLGAFPVHVLGQGVKADLIVFNDAAVLIEKSSHKLIGAVWEMRRDLKLAHIESTIAEKLGADPASCAMFGTIRLAFQGGATDRSTAGKMLQECRATVTAGGVERAPAASTRIRSKGNTPKSARLRVRAATARVKFDEPL